MRKETPARQTQRLAPDAPEERLDWFTYDIEPDRTQICAILQLLLSEIAQDDTIPFPQTRQAFLKALRRAHDQHRPTD
jgi:hypothetical protein